METLKNGMSVAAKDLDSYEDWQEFYEDLVEAGSAIERDYPQIRMDCWRRGISERQLWKNLALYLADGVVSTGEDSQMEVGGCSAEKLRSRTLALIGKLPPESLEDFRGLIATTSTFLRRAEFVCDLVVYLFAEREKGIEREETAGHRYTDYFVEKLSWELGVIETLGQERPLAEVEEEYRDWLTDRIVDGEVLI